MTNLGALAGALDSEALDVNADGSVVVGGCSFNAGRQAFRWTPSGGMQQIGSLPFGLALSVSDDGYLVVGVYGNNARTAFLWHPAIGVVSLENYLQSRGVDLTGWSLDSVADLKVSGNGRFVVGGASFNGSAAAFIADIGVITPWESPCSSSDLFVDHQVNGADLGILLSQWGLAPAGTVSDINRDGLVNGADLGYLLNAWGPCPN